MGEVFVAGVAATVFGRPRRAIADLAHEATRGALADAGLAEGEIAAVFVGCAGTGTEPDGDAVSLHLGLRRLGLGRAEHVSASAAEAIHLGWKAIEMGAYPTVLCVGAERLAPGEPDGDGDGDRGLPAGNVLRARAAAAERYMATSGASLGHLARIVAKNRRHGARNPHARAREEVAVDAVLRSDVLAWPLTRMMVASPGEGAAAVILASAEAGRTVVGRAPRLRACVLAPSSGRRRDGTAERAAALAYQAAGIGPDDVDCAELGDVTAAAELAAYEALQFAPEGQGPELIDSGFTTLGGVLPVNTSGGLLSLGELDGASGIAQLCELTWQLRGDAGARQVDGARAGLAECGGRAGDGSGLAAVSILSAA